MPSTTQILAIRHGETTWNRDGRIQGHLDVDLNQNGRWQAGRLAQALREEPIAAFYASDLARAHETAQAVARLHGATVQTHASLRERGFGSYEGQTWAALEPLHAEGVAAWRRREPGFAPPGGESLLQLQARVLAIVGELAQRHAGQQLLIVAHGGVMDILYRAATGLGLQAPRSWVMSNTAINRLAWKPQGLSLVRWGDTNHLQAQGSTGPLDERTA